MEEKAGGGTRGETGRTRREGRHANIESFLECQPNPHTGGGEGPPGCTGYAGKDI